MKNFKRLFAFLAVVLLVLSTQITAFAAAVPPSTVAAPGDIVTISFEYGGIGGIYGVLSFSNPDMIEDVEISVDPDFQGRLNNYTMAYFSTSPKTFSATLKITIADTAVEGDECEVTLQYETTVDGRVPDTQVYSYETSLIVIEEEIDYSALLEQIAIVEALDEDEYTEESWNAMMLVYEQAKNLVDNASTQKEVDDLTDALKEAIANLVKKSPVVIDYSALLEQIAIVEALDEDEYTEESWNAMMLVYEQAKNLVDNASNQEEVDDLTDALKEAIANLVKKSTDKQGDATNLLIFAAIALVSALGVAYVAKKR